MVRVAAKLIILFLLVYVGVHLGYARLEKELLRGTCCASGPSSDSAGSGKQERGESTSKSMPSTALKNNESNAVGTRQDFQVIVRRNIFQTVFTPEIAQPVEEVKLEAVPTTLNLTLLGTVLGSDQTSRAIIIDNSKKEQNLFQIGDAVQGAFIESVERGKVTLDVNGSIEILLMKKREGGGPGPPKLPRRITRPVPKIPTDDIENIETDDEENKAKRIRRPPVVRPHRRVNFRRNPARAESEGGEEEQENELPAEEELPSPVD
jgi:type II secretory pathway component PulC